MKAKLFQRKIEDFICGRCGAKVSGNGYTNHCPKCLWSKHVDRNPGDRAENCAGLMKPVGGVKERRGYVLTQQCVECGFEKRNSLSPEDDFDAFLALAGKLP